MTAVLGINAYHADAAACLVIDGAVVAAAEEERFTRTKHQAGFPAQAAAWCLQSAGLCLSELAAVAINSDPTAHRLRKVVYSLVHRPEGTLLLDRWRNRGKRAGIGAELALQFPECTRVPPIVPVEHHLAHLASAYLASSFDDALVVSVDGFGDFAGAAWADARAATLRIRERVHFPHSLGIFYQALTQLLGFRDYGDEYKLMGLAAHGEARPDPRLEKVLQVTKDGRFRLGLEYFRHSREAVPYRWSDGPPQVGDLYSPALERLLGRARAPGQAIVDRHIALAAAVQWAYEQALFALLRQGHDNTRSRRLALAGGCAMNSVANGKILANVPFDELYIPSAAGDAGGAMGAALWVWQRLTGGHTALLRRANLGPAWSDRELADRAADWHADQEPRRYQLRTYADEPELLRQAAADLDAGKVVGWFQGAMEFGPRALGQRSILADPRRIESRERINRTIKRRETFRPFAPAVTREAVGDWFEAHSSVHFMEQVLPVRAACRQRIPAVTHVDGSARLQTVTKQDNPRFHGLLRAFEAITGVPVLLNTSFNVHEPIVRTPEEALHTFRGCEMDVLYLGLSRIARHP